MTPDVPVFHLKQVDDLRKQDSMLKFNPDYPDQIVQLTKERDEARRVAEYWHRRFFSTDGYDTYNPKTNGWLPIKWGADGKVVYTEPPMEDEDDIIAAAERQYERENDTPTEPRSDLD